MKTDIVLAGVGGQGILSIATILGAAALRENLYIKQAEVHGMSQRGGSVSSQVRYGAKVLSPVIEHGGADVLVSFEKMEALRWLEYLKVDGAVIVNDHEIPPMPVISGAAEYPEAVLEALCDKAQTIVINAAEEAEKLGSAKAMNVVLLGAAIQRLGLEEIEWVDIIKNNVKPQFVQLNLKALEKGKALAKKK